jgi:hypothetical protein
MVQTSTKNCKGIISKPFHILSTKFARGRFSDFSKILKAATPAATAFKIHKKIQRVPWLLIN